MQTKNERMTIFGWQLKSYIYLVTLLQILTKHKINLVEPLNALIFVNLHDFM